MTNYTKLTMILLTRNYNHEKKKDLEYWFLHPLLSFKIQSSTVDNSFLRPYGPAIADL